ncbi:MAG TPA: hypothetical protein VMC81_12800 [Rhodocyclaceae bacterium]|nr:hypothetical protein [Rhodocyclaceae bacterium]
MRIIAGLRRYIVTLPKGKIVLWCYLIWYLVVVARYFDPAPAIWLNSCGIAVVIGFALLLSVGAPGRRNGERWQTFRLFAMPFCVSSFAALIKDKGFLLIIPPAPGDLAWIAGSCGAFILLIGAVKSLARGQHSRNGGGEL